MDTNPHLTIYQCSTSLAAKYRHATTKLAESFGLTGAQLGALCMLDAYKPVPMKYLCILLTCDASNVTGIIERLVHSGFIQREDSLEDRRVKMIRLTTKGIHLRQLAIAHFEETGPHGLTRLTAQEQQQLATLLEKASVCND